MTAVFDWSIAEICFDGGLVRLIVYGCIRCSHFFFEWKGVLSVKM